MGAKVENYCDGCGTDIGEATIMEAVRISALGTSGYPVTIHLCMQPEFQAPKNPNQPHVTPPPKIKGCAKKILTKAMLAELYKEVAAYTGDESELPFAL